MLCSAIFILANLLASPVQYTQNQEHHLSIILVCRLWVCSVYIYVSFCFDVKVYQQFEILNQPYKAEVA